MLNHWKLMLQKLRTMRRLMHLSLLMMMLMKLLYLQLKMLRMKLRLRLMRLLLALLMRRLEPQYLLLFVVPLCLLDMLMYYMQRRWFEARLVIGLSELQVV
jgi:hypothetical protein